MLFLFFHSSERARARSHLETFTLNIFGQLCRRPLLVSFFPSPNEIFHARIATDTKEQLRYGDVMLKCARHLTDCCGSPWPFKTVLGCKSGQSHSASIHGGFSLSEIKKQLFRNAISSFREDPNLKPR